LEKGQTSFSCLQVKEMTLNKQRKAFDLELHGLIVRFLDQFDLPPEALLDSLICEEMFLIAMAFSNAEEAGDKESEDWEENGE